VLAARARTSLTVALRAILDPPLRATAALIEAAGTGECPLGAELENWGKKKKRRVEEGSTWIIVDKSGS
jgi:hypothetical protein